MPSFEWRGDGVFHDHGNDREVAHGETVDLREAVGGPHDELVEVDADDAFASAEDVADAHWRTAVDAIEAGDVDAYLSDLEDIDDRDSVITAIDDRKSELEG